MVCAQAGHPARSRSTSLEAVRRSMHGPFGSVGGCSDTLPQMKEAGLNLLKLLLISTLVVTTGKLSWDAGLAIGLIFLLPLDWRPVFLYASLHFIWS